MPRASNKVGKYVKPGTNNKDQAAKRDAARAAAEEEAAAAALRGFRSPPAAEQTTEEATPATEIQMEPAYVPSVPELQEQQRQAITWKYMALGCPPETEWSRHGGVLRQIADMIGLPDPCDYRPIKQILRRYLNGEELYRPGYKGGQQPKLTFGEAMVSSGRVVQGVLYRNEVTRVKLHQIWAFTHRIPVQ